MSRPTVRQIAEIAGVSPATVSRVLNEHAHVSESTRHKVFRAMEKAGYEPRAARAQGGQQRVVALILPHVSTPFYSAVLQGVERAAFERRYDLILYTTEGRSDSHVIDRLRAARTPIGVIVVTPRPDGERILQCLAELTLPVVVVDHRSQGSGFPHVCIDNLRAAHAAVRYLIDQGHRRVGIIHGPLEIVSALDRLRGYRLALEEAEIPYDTDLVWSGDFNQESGYERMRQWLEAEKPLPDALFCSNDLMAAGALQALQERGIDVPGGIAVMGFDDLPVARFTRPSLTTIEQPITAMGATAAKLLLRLAAGEQLESDRIVLETRLVVRESA